MKRPITSPSVVLTSSPAMTSSGSCSWSRSDPSAVLWSVSAIRSRPSRRAAATRSSSLVELSCENRECMWKSTFHMQLALREERDDLGFGPGADRLRHQDLLGPEQHFQHLVRTAVAAEFLL